MANSTVGYIALMRQLASFARLGRRSLDTQIDTKINLILNAEPYPLRSMATSTLVVTSLTVS